MAQPGHSPGPRASSWSLKSQCHTTTTTCWWFFPGLASHWWNAHWGAVPGTCSQWHLMTLFMVDWVLRQGWNFPSDFLERSKRVQMLLSASSDKQKTPMKTYCFTSLRGKESLGSGRGLRSAAQMVSSVRWWDCPQKCIDFCTFCPPGFSVFLSPSMYCQPVVPGREGGTSLIFQKARIVSAQCWELSVLTLILFLVKLEQS